MIDIHNKFINGHFPEAYTLANEIIELQDVLNIRSARIRETNKTYCNVFYRSRTKDPKSILKSDDMFHIPLSKRFHVGSQRFSVPGVPCLYLGSSSYVCWLEAGRPAENTFFVSAFYPLDDLSILDLTLTPLSFDKYSFPEIQNDEISNPLRTGEVEIKKEILKMSLEKLDKFLITYPITLACGIKVTDINERNRSFKEEYIVPQLILQSLARNGIDGISYLSAYVGKNNDIKLFINYAFPVKPENENFLKTKFHMSSPIVLAEARNITNSRNNQFTLDCVRDAISHNKVSCSTIGFSNVGICISDSSFKFGYNSTDFFTIDDVLKKNVMPFI